MPRGVPKNGVRRTRSVISAQAAGAGEPALAAGAVDDAAPDLDEAEVEEAPQDDLAGALSGEMPGGELTGGETTMTLAELAGPGAAVELTPEQRQIKELKDQLARERGRKDVEPEVEDQPAQAPANPSEVIRIHFLEDGLTVNGRVMYRGDELEFPVTGRAYKDTFNRLGKTWLDLRHDEFGQVDKWGKIMFRSGPWPGKSYADGKWESLRTEKGDAMVSPPSEDQIIAAERARNRRSAPLLPTQI